MHSQLKQKLFTFMDWVAYWHDRAGMVAQFLLLKWFTVLLWMRLKIISWKIVLTEDTKLIFLFDNWFFLKRANPGLFFFSFYLFKHVTNFTTDTFGEKCPSSILCRDLNSWPLEHEPPTVTTRPGLPPLSKTLRNIKISIQCDRSITIYAINRV